jgi:putative YphP/YqiW family bacilliredoxin
MPYPPELVDPMREELTRMGIREIRNAEDAELALAPRGGTTMLVVNSVCGCAAANARPAVGLALQHGSRPERVYTVFAGQDVEAAAKAREYIRGYPPSSPCIALFQGGELVLMLERKDIEGRQAPEIAGDLVRAFDRYCAPQAR